MADLEKRADTKPESDDAFEGSGGNSTESDYGINERKLIAKVDMRLLPIVSILYLLSFLDRSNGKRPRKDCYRY